MSVAWGKEVSVIDKYYKTATTYLQHNNVERAITAFVAGLDNGSVKCAYGVLSAVTKYKSHTLTDDEALDIFESNYKDIKKLAEDGDAEAMVMVAESIKNGFAEDDEPYMYWIQRASESGDAVAISLIREEEDDGDDSDLFDEKTADKFVDQLKDTVLQSDPDETVLDDLGLLEHKTERPDTNT